MNNIYMNKWINLDIIRKTRQKLAHKSDEENKASKWKQDGSAKSKIIKL